MMAVAAAKVQPLMNQLPAHQRLILSDHNPYFVAQTS
jgi:hypothetical protein